jgi:hypothetical protein
MSHILKYAFWHELWGKKLCDADHQFACHQRRWVEVDHGWCSRKHAEQEDQSASSHSVYLGISLRRYSSVCIQNCFCI